MIENDQQLEATFQALGCLYRAVASLRKRILPVNPQQYGLFAEGPLDEISKLQAEIDAYLGLTGGSVLHTAAPLPGAAPALHEQPPAFGAPEES